MQKVSDSARILKVILSVFTVFYLTGVITPFLQALKDNSSIFNLEALSVILMFLIFLVAFIYVWFDIRITGFILMAWHVILWIFSLTIWPEPGMVILMGVPILVIAVLLILEAHKKSVDPVATPFNQWKFALKLLLYNYVILYSTIVLTSFSNNSIDYFSIPFALFPLLLLVFLAGFYISFKNKIYAGLIFITWYILLVIGSISYQEIFETGPWLLCGLAIFLQGILYLVIRSKWIN